MQTKILIDGQWRAGAAGDAIEVRNPADASVIAEVAAGTADDAYAGCEAAAGAQRAWAATPPRERSELLRRTWQLMIDHTEELARLITMEHGKPLADSYAEVAYAAEFFRWNAEEAVRLHGTISRAPAGTNRVLVHHVPVGVVVIVTPWNFPAAMITRKLAPALAAGNTAVIKPAKNTPLTALRIGELMTQAGFPPGVVNIVPTARSGAWFERAISHQAVRMVSFTGSTEVGRTLLAQSSERILKMVMELGGNAPFIVFADADLDAVISGAMVAKMRHSAEACTAANRFYVEAPVAEEFAVRLSRAMADLRVGNGLDDGVTCGPMIDDEAIASIDDLVQGAVSEGANVLTGGHPIERPGSFYAPTVLADVTHDATIIGHEIFGPVAPIVTFTDTDAMIDQANDTEMGLAAYVYSGDVGRGLAVSERIEAGMIGLNRGVVSDPASPFGGMKQSGLGREGGFEGIYEFTETQYIATDW